MAPLDAADALWQRRHAFQRPLHASQLLAMSAVGMSAVTFYLFGVRELPQYMQLTCTLLFSLQLFMVVLLFMIISFLDPAHPAVIRRQQQQEDATPCILSPSSALAPSRDSHHDPMSSRHANSPSDVFTDRPSPARRIKCSLCRVFVSRGTHHCSVCNKCIVGFDHHCVYLNTCIGARNYPLFIGLLSCSVLLITTQMIVTGFAISQLLQTSHSSAAVRITMLCCLSLLPLLQLVCMLVLASFHLYLYAKGLRTHEFLQQWYRSRSDSSSLRTSTTNTNKQHQHPEAKQIVQIHITERSSGGTNTTISSSSSRSSPNHTDQEQDAYEQVDTASACEPMALLNRQYEAEDHSPLDSEQRRLV